MYRCYYYYYPLLLTILFLCFEKQKIDRKKWNVNAHGSGSNDLENREFLYLFTSLGEYQNQLSNFWSAENETFTEPSSNIIIIEEWESTIMRLLDIWFWLRVCRSIKSIKIQFFSHCPLSTLSYINYKRTLYENC